MNSPLVGLHEVVFIKSKTLEKFCELQIREHEIQGPKTFGKSVKCEIMNCANMNFQEFLYLDLFSWAQQVWVPFLQNMLKTGLLSMSASGYTIFS